MYPSHLRCTPFIIIHTCPRLRLQCLPCTPHFVGVSISESLRPSIHLLVRHFLLFWVFAVSIHVSICPSIHLLVRHTLLFWVFAFWAAAPKGSMIYAFTHMGDFLLLLRPPPPLTQILASRPKTHPQGPNPSLKAQIPVFGLQRQDFGPKAEI